MGASLKHKILTLALILTASTAFAGESDMAASTGDCVECALAAATNPPIAADKMPARLPVAGADTRALINRTGADAQFNDVGAIAPADDIQIQDGDANGVRNGKIKTGKFASTAGLINPCQVLTNYHSVLGDVSAPTDAPTNHRAEFFVGADASGKGLVNSVKGTVKYVGNYFVDGKSVDFAIVNLDQCAGNDSSIGYHDTANIDADMLRGTTVTEVGFPNDKSGHDLSTMKPAKQQCTILGTAAGTTNMSISCRTAGGGSGSMIFATGKDGKKYVIGVALSEHSVVDPKTKAIGWVSEVVTVSQISESINHSYGVNFKNSNATFAQKYGPKTRPQVEGPTQLASATN